MLDSIVSILALATLILAAYGIGRPLLRGLRLEPLDALEVGVWSTALGLVCFGLVLAGLGMLGVLFRPLIGVLTLAAGFLGLGELSQAHVRRRRGADRALPFVTAGALKPSSDRPASWLRVGLALLSVGTVLCALIAALAPPTAGDALCYHLELPKQFLAQGALVYLPDSENSTFPLLVELWYLWALSLDGAVAAQLVHWALGVLLALATVVLATPVVGRPWAWCSAAVVLLVPGVSNEMTAPLNDVALAAFSTLALAAWWRATVEDRSRRWFLLAGWMLGGALGIKYVALLCVLSVAPACVWQMWRQPDRRRRLLEGFAAAILVAVSASGLWYVRAAWHRGNPVYPFFEEYVRVVARDSLPETKAPLGRDPVALSTAPWQITMRPDRLGGGGHQPGPLYLATLPLLLLVRRLRGVGVLLGICAAYLAGWFCLRQNIRFLLPMAPVAAVPVVWVWMELRRFPRLPAVLCGALTVAMLSLGAGAAALRARGKVAVATGWETRREYLLDHEPTFALARWANALLPEGCRILSQEQRAFYFNASLTRESVFRRRTRYNEWIKSPTELSPHLRTAGFTHLLLAEPVHAGGPRYNGTLSRLVDAAMVFGEPSGLECLREHVASDSSGAERRYRIVALK